MKLYSFFYGAGKHPESYEQAHPHGIRLLFALFRWHWMRLIGLNVLFLLSCLPVVTIPCALTAMSRVMGLMVQRKICYVTSDYWQSFKIEWKRSMLTGVLAFGMVAVCGIGIRFYIGRHTGESVVLAGILLLAIVVIAAAGLYMPPMLAFTALGVRDVFKNALILSVTALPRTAATLLVVIGLMVVMSLYLPVMVLCFVLFGFSLVALIAVWSVWPVLERYVFSDAKSD